MPFSPQSSTAGRAMPATSGGIATENPPTASNNSVPPIPGMLAIDIPPSPSKQSNIPPNCISATLDSNWIFIDSLLIPGKESLVPPPVQATRVPSWVLRFLEKTLLLLLLLLAVGFLCWLIFAKLVYSGHGPKFQIDSALVNTSVVHKPLDHYVRADWNIEISAANPNPRTVIVYKSIAVRMSHGLDEFGVWEAIGAPFQQEAGDQTRLFARSEPESKGTKLQYEILDTVLEFNVTMFVELSYKCLTCLKGSFELEVVCPGVKVFYNSNGPRIEGSQQCSVQDERKIN